MHIRVKFGKHGAMKYIGHLDVMRYFQKALRRAEIDVKYTGGFSPHMIMSFASPLGVGVTSDGEYFDMEVNETYSSQEAVARLNAVMADGMVVHSYVEIPGDKKNKGMSLVAGAAYTVRFRDDYEPVPDWEATFHKYLEKDEILVMKKTKKSEKEVDIRPFVYEGRAAAGEIYLQLAAGSVTNIKPDIVMDGFARYLDIEFLPFSYQIHRVEMYANAASPDSGAIDLIPLEKLGEEIG